ncbi:MAG TPA: DNA replication/repair protein RecF [Novosphingobium sp.]|nr:DNA replication/repair protein RecF [Novosphingobium sp.]
MGLARITLTHFRNHAATCVEGTAGFNLLVGENGAGKTNVLEAISLLAPGRGLRRAPLADMANRAGEGGFAISAELAGGGLRLGTGTAPDRPGRRLVRINGADASALALSEWLALAWLTPAMDRLFADSPGARRRFMDRMALAIAPAHATHAARTEAALRERNRLLAAEHAPDPAWLDAVEAQLAEAGAALTAGRARLVEALAALIERLPPSPFARPVLALAPGGPDEAGALAEALRAARPRDRAAGRSLTGPQRDDLLVTMAAKNQPAADCSTGEQKAMLIAITLAHAELAAMLDRAGDAPPRARLLLLDEVAAHLDPIRRGALFERLAHSGAQVWLTGTEPAPFADLQGRAACWRVTEGRVLPITL